MLPRATFFLLVLSLFFPAATLGQTSMLWVEAENPAQSNFAHFDTSDMGKPELLSAGQWIMKGIGPEEVEQLVPEEGIRLTYDLDVAAAGNYNFWARVGWFNSRAAFRWRVGDGDWRDAPSGHPTTNLMEMGFFCEISWADLGEVALKPGRTALEVVYPRTTGEKERMLVAADCFAFVQGHFVPEGPFKPGQVYDDSLSQAAGEQVFDLPKPQDVARASVALTGPWQVARYDDPDMDADTYVPIQELPSPNDYPLRWMGFEVPGSPWNTPALVFGHRLIYRTRVAVPDQHTGRGFTLHFSGTNWIVSVFVNGKLAGTHRGVWVPWDLDVSKHIRPGQTNEIAVAVKGTYYAMDAKAIDKNGTLMGMRNRPLSRKDWTRWVAPIYPSTKGDGDGYQYGIVNPVTLQSVGAVYTEDVFIKPSVEKKSLQTDLTVRNTGPKPQTAEIRCEAVSEKSGEVEKSLGPVSVTVPAGAVKTIAVSGEWQAPRLWWPKPNPDLYRLRTTVSISGRVVDVSEETFGFREVTIRGTGVYINGVRRNFWNWVDVHGGFIERPEQWVDQLHEDGSRFMRFSHGRKITSTLPTREERLDFYDRAGVPGRLCTMIDGMFITFNLGERTKDDQGNPLLIVNEPVWENFREHMAQVAKAYRNHPSVIFYQVENELVYINGMNIYGGYLDRVEELMSQVCEAGRAQDPTRPYTVGGGGDLSGKLEINSPHYPTAAYDHYPENAYTIDRYATKIERWPWDRSKPWIVGESCFAKELEYGAYVAGDRVFRGVDEAKRGKAKWLRMLYGGYRWAGVAGFFPWDNLWNYEDGQKIFSPLAVIPRKQTSRLFADGDNSLSFKVMNDTLSSEPVTFRWTYIIGESLVAQGRQTLQIEPGHGKEVVLLVKAPKTDVRLDGLLELIAEQDGAKTYVDRRPVPVLPAVTAFDAGVPIHVLRPNESLRAFLQKAGIPYSEIGDLDSLKGKADGLLLVAPDALTAQEAYGTGLLAFAASGGRVICLEQDFPPAGAALPVPLKTTTRLGGYAHPQALGTPVFRDLGADDLIDWAGDHPTFKAVYQKPSQGGRSLVEAGEKLQYSPLVEVPCGQGIMVLCQLRVGAKLGVDPAAEVLLRNLIQNYAEYTPAQGVAALYCPGNSMLAEKVAATGALVEHVKELADGLDPAKYRALVVEATPQALKVLNSLEQSVRAFQEAGGWVVLCGLEPDGIRPFNDLVDGQFQIRPFRMERVTLENPSFPLAATLGNRDMALISPQQIMHGRYYVSQNTFSYCIDRQDFAPFTQPPGAPQDPMEYEPTFDDHDPFNFVNGMLSSDFWKYIQQLWIPEEGTLKLTFNMRRPDVLKTIKIWNNETYWTIEDLEIVIDGDTANPIRTTLPDSRDVTTIELPEATAVQKTITLEVRSWRERPIKRTDVRLVGIDNLQFLRPKEPTGSVSIDNAGGLVAFPRGTGGVLLSQIKFMAEEPRPENAAKKLRMLGVLLQNMGIGSKAASVVAVPGLNVRFTPVTIQEFCTAYLDEKPGKTGWFGRKGENLSALPRGRHDFADVTYHVVDYATAPVPDCIILGGRGAPGALRDLPESVRKISVGAKADLLYFLHTAHTSRPIRDDERRRMEDTRRPFLAPTVAQYVIHYADGKTATIDILLEQHVDHWLQTTPRPLASAQIAWTAPIGEEGQRAVVYSMQATNPRPDVAIDSIEILAGEGRAAPAVLGITLGEIIGQ
jgi:glycosyl hydrolase family 2